MSRGLPCVKLCTAARAAGSMLEGDPLTELVTGNIKFFAQLLAGVKTGKVLSMNIYQAHWLPAPWQGTEGRLQHRHEPVHTLCMDSRAESGRKNLVDNV